MNTIDDYNWRQLWSTTCLLRFRTSTCLHVQSMLPRAKFTCRIPSITWFCRSAKLGRDAVERGEKLENFCFHFCSVRINDATEHQRECAMCCCYQHFHRSMFGLPLRINYRCNRTLFSGKLKCTWRAGVRCSDEWWWILVSVSNSSASLLLIANDRFSKN